ncbi:MAG: hypothetical protein ABIG34_04985 [Candidatus Peregrinibacteria bacterium]
MDMDNAKSQKATEKTLLEELRRTARALEELDYKLDLQLIKGDLEGSVRTKKALEIGRKHFYMLSQKHKKLWKRRRSSK